VRQLVIKVLIYITQNVHVKLNPGLPWKKQLSTKRRLFFQRKIGITFKEDTSKVLHLEHRFVWR